MQHNYHNNTDDKEFQKGKQNGATNAHYYLFVRKSNDKPNRMKSDNKLLIGSDSFCLGYLVGMQNRIKQNHLLVGKDKLEFAYNLLFSRCQIVIQKHPYLKNRICAFIPEFVEQEKLFSDKPNQNEKPHFSAESPTDFEDHELLVQVASEISEIASHKRKHAVSPARKATPKKPKPMTEQQHATPPAPPPQINVTINNIKNKNIFFVNPQHTYSEAPQPMQKLPVDLPRLPEYSPVTHYTPPPVPPTGFSLPSFPNLAGSSFHLFATKCSDKPREADIEQGIEEQEKAIFAQLASTLRDSTLHVNLIDRKVKQVVIRFESNAGRNNQLEKIKDFVNRIAHMDFIAKPEITYSSKHECHVVTIACKSIGSASKLQDQLNLRGFKSKKSITF